MVTDIYELYAQLKLLKNGEIIEVVIDAASFIESDLNEALALVDPDDTLNRTYSEDGASITIASKTSEGVEEEQNDDVDESSGDVSTDSKSPTEIFYEEGLVDLYNGVMKVVRLSIQEGIPQPPEGVPAGVSCTPDHEVDGVWRFALSPDDLVVDNGTDETVSDQTPAPEPESPVQSTKEEQPPIAEEPPVVGQTPEPTPAPAREFSKKAEAALAVMTQYAKDMGPHSPMNEETGSQHQMSLMYAIYEIMDLPTHEFNSVFNEALKIFHDHRNGAFSMKRISRFTLALRASPAKLKFFTTMTSIMVRTADPQGRHLVMTTMVDKRSLAKSIENPDYLNRLLQFYYPSAV